jgi:hypothetical protein
MLTWLDRWTRRQLVLAGLFISLVLVTLPFVEMLLGLRTGMYNDINGAHLPRYVGVWQNLRNGDSPFWWDRILSGVNALGAGQSAVFYAPNAIFGWVNPVTAFRWWFFAHLWLMAGGWYAWSLHRWQSVPGAVVSAVVGVLNGVLVSHLVHTPYIAAFMLVPWIMLTFDLVIERRQRRYIAFLALLLAGLAFTGQPQMLWILLLGCGVSAVVMAVGRRTDWMALVRFGAAVATGLALAAAALIPQVLFGRTSVRPTLDRAGAFEFAEEPRHLWTLIAPNIMGGSNSAWGWRTPWLGGTQQPEQVNYLGIVGLALAVIAVVVLRRDRRVWAFMVVGVFALLSSLGGHTPFGDLVYSLVPYADRFRIWSRNLLLLNIGVSCLAGAGMREVLRRPRRWLAPLAIGTAGTALVLALLPALTNLGGALLRGTEGTVARLLPVVFLMAFVAALALTIVRWRAGIVALLVVCAADMGSFAAAGLWRGQGATPAEARAIWGKDAPGFGQPVDQPGGIDRWVSDVPDSSTLWPSSLPGTGPTINGYDSLMQADYSLSVGDMSYNGFLRTPLFWSGGWLPDVLRTTTLVASGYAGLPAPDWTAYGTYGFSTLYSYTPRLDEAYLVGAARADSLNVARAALADPATDLTQYAYIDTATVDSEALGAFAAARAEGPSGSVVSGAMDGGGHGSWTVDADRPSVFVVSYAWAEGWHATVDGKRVPVARTNALVLGVPVPAGTHEVRLEFTPPGWSTGRNLSILGIVAVAALLLSDISRTRWSLLLRSMRTGVKRRQATDGATSTPPA